MPAGICEAMGDAEANSLTLVRAPARVNIIGEHTDYNDGLVLPTTTALHTWVCASPREDRFIEVKTQAFEETRRFSLDELEPGADVEWDAYVKGVVAEIAAEGITLRGANLLIDSDIPRGAGLSSSASLELAVATVMLEIVDTTIPAPRLAQICQRAEHRYAGVRCGIMDQYTIACAEPGKAVLLDCRSLESTQVPLPPNIGFLIVDSGVRHRLPDGDYNSRADECATAVAVLANKSPGLTSLRHLSMAMLEKNRDELGDLLYRRCRHVVSENDRVRRAEAALRQNDAAELGRLLSDGHASLRDDFDVSCDEVETVVDLVNGCSGVLGSRMVGAGFGGCVLAATKADRIAAAAQEIAKNYAAVVGREPWVHVVTAANPVQRVTTR